MNWISQFIFFTPPLNDFIPKLLSVLWCNYKIYIVEIVIEFHHMFMNVLICN